MISGIHLKTNLPSNITFKLVTYGCPRVGNQAFADYIDENFPGVVARIANKLVPTPIFCFLRVWG
jgi:predicted lipase